MSITHIAFLKWIGCFLVLFSSLYSAENIVFFDAKSEKLKKRDDLIIASMSKKAPVIDGRIKAQEWKVAGRSHFTLKTRQYTTVFKTMYDKKYLYFSFFCEEPKIKEIDNKYSNKAKGRFGPDKNGDVHVYNDDSIEIFLFSEDGKTRYQFIANLVGAHFDGKIQEYNKQPEWRGQWESKSKLLEKAWTMEVRIKRSSLKFKKGEQLYLGIARNRYTGGKRDMGSWHKGWGNFSAARPLILSSLPELSIQGFDYGNPLLGNNKMSFVLHNLSKLKKNFKFDIMVENKVFTKKLSLLPNQKQPVRFNYSRMNYLQDEIQISIQDQVKKKTLTWSDRSLKLKEPLSYNFHKSNFMSYEEPEIDFHLFVGKRLLKSLSLAVNIYPNLSKKSTPVKHGSYSIKKNSGKFKIPKKYVTLGNHAIQLQLLSSEGKILYQSKKVPFRIEQHSTKKSSGKILLHLDAPKHSSKSNKLVPYSLGVPFPKGSLFKDQPVQVQRNGKALPTQFTPLAFWESSEKTVRWLLVDFQAPMGAEKDVYELCYGTSIIPAPKPIDIGIIEEKGAVTVDTGVAKFQISIKDRLTIDSIKLYDQSSSLLSQPLSFWIERSDGKKFYATGDLIYKVEDHGCVRTSIRSKGWYKAKDGEKFCQHDIRLQFFESSSQVKIFHTFIFTETSDSAQLNNISLSIPLHKGNDEQVHFGNDSSIQEQSYKVNNPKHCYLVQDNINRYNLEYKIFDGKSKKVLSKGSKYSGWADFSHSKGGVTSVIREAWQNYPNEIEISDSTMHVHLWPKHGRQLDFRTDAVLAIYGKEGVKMIDKFFQTVPTKNHRKSIYDLYNNAMGLAKTHELFLDFHSSSFKFSDSEPSIFQATHPVFAYSDPEWNGETKAIGPIHHLDKEQFPQLEEALDAMFDRYTHWRDYYMDFGWLDYQDVHCHARDDSFSHPVEGGQIARLWRHWDSTHYGLPNCPWVLYYRSGKRKYLEFAEANSRKCMDINRCHYGDGEKRIKGTHYYADYSIIPWNGDPYLTNYAKLEYMLYYYYMRGYRRGKDVMQDWGEAVKELHDDFTKNFPLRILKPRYENIRHLGPPLGNLTELYRVTWDREYLNIAKDYADGLIKIFPKDNFDYFCQYANKIDYCWEGMANYYRLTNHPEFKNTILKYADMAMSYTDINFSFSPDSFGFLLSKDQSFLDHGKYRVMRFIPKVNTGKLGNERGASGIWTSGIYPYMLRSLPRLMAAFAAAPEEWKKREMPLFNKNTSFRMPGPNHAKLFLKTLNDNASIKLRLGHKQKMVLSDGRGSILLEEENKFNSRGPNETLLIDLPLSESALSLTFPLSPTRIPSDYVERGAIGILKVENTKLVAEPNDLTGEFSLFGPKFYFFVPKHIKKFTVTVDTTTLWGAYAWHPVVNIFDPNGRIAKTQKGPGVLSFKITADETQRGKLWSLGPIGRGTTPSANFPGKKRPPEANYPAFFKLSLNLPQYVSTHPDLFFIPDIDE